MTERQKKLVDVVENCHKDMLEKERARLKPYEDKIAERDEDEVIAWKEIVLPKESE